MSHVHVVSFCNLIGTARARRRKSTTFPVDVTRLFPPPVFEERAWGRGYDITMDQLPEVIVRGKSVLTFPDLLAAGRFYVQEYYKQWPEHREICIVPPIPWTVYNRALGPCELMKDGTKTAKERGDNAEVMVYKNVFKCGEGNGESMFLIAQVDYDPDNKSKQTPAMLKSFLSDPRQQEQLSRVTKKMDVDLTIVHAEIGAIIIEIKATANPLVEIGDAVVALHKAEDLLRIFCVETFPIYKVVVFPNCESLSEHQEKEMKRLEEKNEFSFCDNAFATYPDAVVKLLSSFKAKTLEKGYPNLIEEADLLLYWLIGLKTIVSSTLRDRKVAKVTLKDEAINLTKQVKQTDAKLVQHDVFSKADLKSGLVRKVTIAREALYLNPEQIAIWDGPKGQVIHGVAGTGKTILIQHKVLELDKSLARDEKITVIATDAVARVYQDFFTINQASDRVNVCSKAMLLFQLMRKALELSTHHVFIDEAQNLEMTQLLTTIGKNRSSAKYLWIAMDPVQALEKMQVSIPQFETELQIPSVLPLRHVMRCTPEVVNYWSKHLPPDCSLCYNQGNRLFVQDVPIYQAGNNDEAVQLIISLLEQYIDGENVTYKDCAVLLHPSIVVSLIPIRKAILQKLGFSEQDFFHGKVENTITIRDLPNDIWSLEWMYVFLVASDAKLLPTQEELDATLSKEFYWDSGIYLASSRCKVQLFLIALDKGKRPNLGPPMIPSRISISFGKR